MVMFIPARLTYLHQLVDVCFAATFKKFYAQGWTAWIVKQLEKAYKDEEESGAYMSKSLNYIKPTMAMCLVWANRAYEKMKAKKNMFKKKAEDLYMRGEDEEMTALMPNYYAGKFKSSHDPEHSWSKGKKRAKN